MKKSVKSFSVFFVIATFVIVSASFVAPGFLSAAKAFGFGMDPLVSAPAVAAAGSGCTLSARACADNGCAAKTTTKTMYYCGPVDDCTCKSKPIPAPSTVLP